MSLPKILSFVCPVSCAACLAIGFALNGQGITLVIALLSLLIWLLARQRPATVSPSVALIVSVGIAAAGLFARASSVLMILSATLALASWDLVLLDHALADNPISSTQTLALFQNRHYQSLALALGSSLLIAALGQLIHFQIPLVMMILLVILTLFSLDRVWRILRN